MSHFFGQNLSYHKPKGHTFHVALFWAKFRFIYSSGGLVCQLRHTSFQNKGSHFSCRTFLSKIYIHMYLWWLGLSTQSYLFPTKGVTLFMSHFFEQNFDIYIVVVVWSVNWTIPVFHKQKGHTFYVALFWAKFLLEHSYESQFSLSTESHLSSPIWGHTFHDTLFWAKFLFIYCCKGLVCHLDDTCLPPKQGSHFSCRTFLSNISIDI